VIRLARDARGQTTTEWLMIAGILTAIGIFFLGIIPSTIKLYAVTLISSLRTIAP
jgi:preprotein translocase subunit Sss1